MEKDIMEKHKDEILFIYNGNKQSDKEALGYAESVKGKKVNQIDLAKETLTERQIADIAIDMNVAVDGLLDKNDKLYLSKIKEGEFTDDELLKLLKNNSSLFKTPIAYIEKEPIFVESQYTFVNKGLEIDGVKSDSGNSFEK